MKNFMIEDISRIIEMAWEDRTPFEATELQIGLKENEVREIMRREMKLSSFKLWCERVRGRSTKHLSLRQKKSRNLMVRINKKAMIFLPWLVFNRFVK